MVKAALSFCILILTVMVLSPNFAIAEPYKDTKFPPLEILQKQNWMEAVFRPGEIVGKIKNSEGSYVLYYKDGNGNLNKLHIIMLDTNIWIIQQAPGFNRMNEGIVQK